MKDKEGIESDKQAELKKYRDLVLATIDYYLSNHQLHFKTADFDSKEYHNALKVQTIEQFDKGRLTRLKQWFRDLTEVYIETGDWKFNQYLQDKTGYDIDIFKSYKQRIEKVVQKGRITTDNQFYDIRTMVDQLCQIEPVDSIKIELLNALLFEYEQRESRRNK